MGFRLRAAAMRLLLLVLVLGLSACGPAVAKCNPTTCAMGCCNQDTDRCEAGTIGALCGGGGSLCVTCPQAQECSSQLCKAKATTGTGSSCTAANCDGCCDHAGTCVGGVVAGSCGASGATCASCAVGQTCAPLNGPTGFGGRCQ
jgi:hypothetical protein